MSRTVSIWTEERKAELTRLAPLYSRAEAAERMGLTEGALKGQAQRQGLKFKGRRRRPSSPSTFHLTRQRVRQADAYADPHRTDAGLRRFSWEGEA